MKDTLPKLITRRELADKCGVCRHTIREYELRGYLTPIKFSKRCIRYRADAVEALLTQLGGRRAR